jgi:hypothetical protein
LDHDRAIFGGMEREMLCQLRVTRCGPRKIEVIKLLREATEASLLLIKHAVDDSTNVLCCEARFAVEPLLRELAQLETTIEVTYDQSTLEPARGVESARSATPVSPAARRRGIEPLPY